MTESRKLPRFWRNLLAGNGIHHAVHCPSKSTLRSDVGAIRALDDSNGRITFVCTACGRYRDWLHGEPQPDKAFELERELLMSRGVAEEARIETNIGHLRGARSTDQTHPSSGSRARAMRPGRRRFQSAQQLIREYHDCVSANDGRFPSQEEFAEHACTSLTTVKKWRAEYELPWPPDPAL
jgi:hypothetical protein